MWQRVQVFAFVLSGKFEKCVQQEIARRDLVIECHRPGVLIARGLLRPTVLAVCQAVCLALGRESDRVQSAKALFRAASTLPKTRVRGKALRYQISEHAHAVNQRLHA